MASYTKAGLTEDYVYLLLFDSENMCLPCFDITICEEVKLVLSGVLFEARCSK